MFLAGEYCDHETMDYAKEHFRSSCLDNWWQTGSLLLNTWCAVCGVRCVVCGAVCGVKVCGVLCLGVGVRCAVRCVVCGAVCNVRCGAVYGV